MVKICGLCWCLNICLKNYIIFFLVDDFFLEVVVWVFFDWNFEDVCCNVCGCFLLEWIVFEVIVGGFEEFEYVVEFLECLIVGSIFLVLWFWEIVDCIVDGDFVIFLLLFCSGLFIGIFDFLFIFMGILGFGFFFISVVKFLFDFWGCCEKW